MVTKQMTLAGTSASLMPQRSEQCVVSILQVVSYAVASAFMRGQNLNSSLEDFDFQKSTPCLRIHLL